MHKNSTAYPFSIPFQAPSQTKVFIALQCRNARIFKNQHQPHPYSERKSIRKKKMKTGILPRHEIKMYDCLDISKGIYARIQHGPSKGGRANTKKNASAATDTRNKKKKKDNEHKKQNAMHLQWRYCVGATLPSSIAPSRQCQSVLRGIYGERCIT